MLVQVLQSNVTLPTRVEQGLLSTGHLFRFFESVTDLKKSTMTNSSNLVLVVLDNIDVTLADVWSLYDSFPEKAILVLNNDDSLESCVDVLNVGADDCVHIHSHASEILARMTAIVCRKAGHASPVFEFHEMKINLLRRSVEYGGERIIFKDQEFRVIEQCVLRNTSTMSFSVLPEVLGGPEKTSTDEHPRSFIRAFQRKLRSLTSGGITLHSMPHVGISIVFRSNRSNEESALGTARREINRAPLGCI